MIVSGESGAGKTESTKLALSYLVWRTRRQAKADGSVYAGFMSLILQANPLMEAFGNVMPATCVCSALCPCIRLCPPHTSTTFFPVRHTATGVHFAQP